MDGVNIRMKFGDRKFYDIQIPSFFQCDDTRLNREKAAEKLFKYVEENCIGKDLIFSGPFGYIPLTYCDYTASGRALAFIEDFIQDEVLPHYGNTHTTTSVTSLQTTLFRHEARSIIRNAVNASEDDAVIFVSSGVTGAIHKLIHALSMKKPPVVFVSPFEHHSNLLSWKEIGAEIVWTAENKKGELDISNLEENLKKYYESDRMLIGSFTAASNVTGVLTDVDAVSACIHQYGGLAFFDYATAAPYIEVNMNPLAMSESQGMIHKDAVFISPHKFVGGPGTPGILIAKKNLFRNAVPSQAGGGNTNTQTYLKEIEMREEGGTPAIVESIRAGLVFQLKEAIGAKYIVAKEEKLVKLALEYWRTIPNLIILGDHGADRLPVFSFVIAHQESGRLLHHNFICTVLNDVFGIQARGGCACAGPYAEELLGLNEELALKYESLLMEEKGLDRHHLRRYREYSQKEILRPGFARLNLPYFLSDDGVNFVLEAVAMVAKHAWKLLPLYNMNPETGEWRHKKNLVFKDRKWLGSINYRKGVFDYAVNLPPTFKVLSYSERLAKGWEVLKTEGVKKSNRVLSDQTLLLGDEGEQYRWFLLPSEAEVYLQGERPASAYFKMPFYPRKTIQKKMKTTTPIRTSHSYHLCAGCNPGYRYNEDIAKHQRINDLLQSGEQEGNDSAYVTSDSLDGDSPNVSQKSSEENNGACSETSDGSNSLPDDSPGSCDNNTSSGKSNWEIGDESVSSDFKTLELSDTPDGRDGVEKQKITNETEENMDEEIKEMKSEEKHASNANETENGINDSKNVFKFHSPPKVIFGPTVEAIEEYSMIENGDRVLLCLSGGKDSLSMLHTLRQYQFYAKAKGVVFEFGAMTVDPQSAAYDPSPLKEYLAKLGVPYFYEEQDIITQASNLPVCESICSFCSRMKRGRMYACARREGYNVLALGQHLDDIAESFLMSVFHNGLLRTMKASYTVKEGDLRVIRPLINVREKDLRTFATQVKLPVIPENCPGCFEAPKERHRTKQLLAHQEVLFPNLFSSIQTALKPLTSKNRTGLESNKNNADSFDEFM
eukprot:gene6974-7759_t